MDGVCTNPGCGQAKPGTGESVTVTVSIKDYAAANGWVNAEPHAELKMDDVVTVTVSGTPVGNYDLNTGKYYTTGYEWRTYQTENASIKVSASDSNIVSVKITYNINKGGVLTLNGTNITSGTVVEVNASSVTFGVGNTGTETKGQVKITAIEVVYGGESGGEGGGETECSHSYTSAVTTQPTCTTPGVKTYTCGLCSNSYTETIPATGHNYVDGTCTVCGAVGHIHSLTNTVISLPTCEEVGITLYSCENCFYSYTVATKATGHKLVDGVCSICGKVFAEDGSSVTVTDDAVEVVLSDKALSGEGDVVALPIPEITVSSSETATAVTIDVSSGKTDAAVKVEIPVAEVTEGTVVVIVHEDGTEEVLKKAAVTENGLAFEVEDKVTVKVVDNTKEFEDVNAGDWSSEAIDFATSREILGGAEDGKFAPKSNMTCLQLTTLLFSMDNNSSDLSDDEVQAKAAEWAETNHIIDSAFNGEETMTREQLAVFIYRYAGAPKVENSDRFNGFADSNTVSSWARDAMIWAVEVGVINGMGDNTLNSTGKATREQVAQVLMNLIQADAF